MADQQPGWGNRLRQLYSSGITTTFRVHGNISDYVVGTNSQPLRKYLLASFSDRDITVYWNRASGFVFPAKEMKQAMIDLLGLQPESGPATSTGRAAAINTLSGAGAQPSGDKLLDQLGRNQANTLEALSQLLNVKPTEKQLEQIRKWRSRRTQEDRKKYGPDQSLRVAIILDYGETIVPESSQGLSEADRSAQVTLSEWASQIETEVESLVMILVAEENELHERLRRSSAHWEPIHIPLPSLEERAAYIEMRLAEEAEQAKAAGVAVATLAEGFSVQEMARLTTGLRLRDCEDIILRAGFLEVPIDRALVKERKDEIMKSEFSDVLTVIDPEEGFNSLGGLELIKADLRESVIEPIRAGNLRLVPIGIMFMGAPGTGKSRLAYTLAKESGMTFVELQLSKIFSKWVGDTEGRLDRALSAVRAMAPCIVFIDEIDQSVTRGESGDNGVSNRVFKRLMEVMADPHLRGKVLFVSSTNRPDLLDGGLIRPERTDKKYPFLTPTAAERADILTKLVPVAFREAEELPGEDTYQNLAARMEHYTGAEISRIVTKALQLWERSGRNVSVDWTLEHAFYSIIPTTRDIARMNELALLNCDDLDLIPEQYREQARALRHPAAKAGETSTAEEAAPTPIRAGRARRREL